MLQELDCNKKGGKIFFFLLPLLKYSQSTGNRIGYGRLFLVYKHYPLEAEDAFILYTDFKAIKMKQLLASATMAAKY